MFGYNRIGCLRMPWPLVCQKLVGALPEGTRMRLLQVRCTPEVPGWELSYSYGASLRWIISMSARRSRKMPPRV